MKLFKRLVPLGTAFLTFAIILGCAAPVRRESGKTYELVLLHTNDHHGTVLPNDGMGGLAERAGFVKSVRAANRNVLLVDAGDINTGTALSNLFSAEPDIWAYNLMGYDAVVFGNHEFDGTQAKLDNQMAEAMFPFVSSNIKTSDGNFLGGHQYFVIDYDGFRVGIFGITTLRTQSIASPDKSLTFLPEIDAAKAVIDVLKKRQKADIIIGLTHLGDMEEYPGHVTSSMLAASVPGIDIIVDGHSHSKYDAPKTVGKTFIVSANEWGKFVGQGKLTVVDGKLVNFIWIPVEINTKNYAPDPELSSMLAPYITRAEASLKEIVGEAADTFIFGNRLTRYQETAIGNMICDANVWYFRNVYNQNVDFAFHNGGNIRSELPRGKLTREQILTVLPFENYLYIVSLKGSEINELFNFIATIPQGSGGFPQFSREVRYTLDVPNKKISNLTIGGMSVDPNRKYRFCTNDYLLAGGDGYTVLTKSHDQFNTSLQLSYVLIEYINSQSGIITPSTDSRLVVIGGVTP
ncbi:MAG: 5'-nucleotidase C-terminal domain-containing protein [Treponema sp.]|jgi:5'-nucleotidase/UDP-sugar diphosphatase|nr:5'-nucleotidase C-terminal domain-containing protein [Treponema sp.]